MGAPYIYDISRLRVKSRHIDISAVKNSYNEENTAAARWGVTAGDALSVCVYIFYM
jgi:hypothetical protein